MVSKTNDVRGLEQRWSVPTKGCALQTEASHNPQVSLRDEVVVVTGAGSRETGTAADELWGIGAAIARYAAAAGACVGVLDVDEASAQRTVDRTTAINREARMLALSADVTDSGSVSAAFDRLRAKFGQISGLVNNVGIGGPAGTASEVDLEAWTAAFDVNVTSMVITTGLAIADLESTRGSVVNISSVAGVRGGHHGLSYPTTKAAIIGLSQTMAGHYGHTGVRVNTVAPGLVHTPMIVSRGLSEENRRKRAAASMLGIEGTSWDVAGPVAFLLSRAAAWITGVTLPVDAGLSALAPNLGVVKSDA